MQVISAFDSMVNKLPYEIKIKILSNVYQNNCKMIIDALENNNMWIFHALDIYPLPKEVIHILFSRIWRTLYSTEEGIKICNYIVFLVEISTKKGFDLLTNDNIQEIKNRLIQLSAANGNLNLFKRLYELEAKCVPQVYP